MAGFQDLPIELIVAIMNYVDTPQDLAAMIHADPWLLDCFLDNRKQVIKPYLNNLLKVCGGHVSTACLLAARLRHAKKDPGFNSHRPQHRERIVSPILLSYIDDPDTQRPLSYRASLATICALSTLAIDVGWITTSYISQARAQIPRYVVRSIDLPEASSKEHQRFINAACRFESYVQAFFHIEQPLFPRDLNIRRLLFAPCLCGAQDKLYATKTFYSIAYYVYDQHCTMLQNIISHLRVGGTPISGRAQDTTQTTEERQKRRLQNCIQLDLNKYVHYLTSQGLGMLLHLQSMALQDQSQFVLSNFESILDSRHPNILVVHGIDLYKIGTVERHSWNPWVSCEHVFEIGANQWKWAESFWDFDRRFLSVI